MTCNRVDIKSFLSSKPLGLPASPLGVKDSSIDIIRSRNVLFDNGCFDVVVLE